MNDTDARHDCPAMPTLVEWFDGTLDHDAADRIEQHLDRCGRCRQSLLRWSERAGAGIGSASETPECPDAETLVAYGAATLDASAAADVERHLHACARCVRVAQSITVLTRQLQNEPPAKATVSTSAIERAEMRATVRPRLTGTASAWWQWLRESLTPTVWPRAAFAAAVVLVLAIGITRFIQPLNQLQEMHGRSGERVEMVEITADTPGRARPAFDEPVVLRVARGTQARWLEASGEWTRIELADGRRVWVETTTVRQVHNK
jgi:anti-sigma factor RsiW